MKRVRKIHHNLPDLGAEEYIQEYVWENVVVETNDIIQEMWVNMVHDKSFGVTIKNTVYPPDSFRRRGITLLTSTDDYIWDNVCNPIEDATYTIGPIIEKIWMGVR